MNESQTDNQKQHDQRWVNSRIFIIVREVGGLYPTTFSNPQNCTKLTLKVAHIKRTGQGLHTPTRVKWPSARVIVLGGFLENRKVLHIHAGDCALQTVERMDYSH